jgi:hypothetical protein
MQNEQLALPGFPKRASAHVKTGSRADLQRQLNELEQRLYNVEFDLMTLETRMDRWEEEDDE